MCRSGIIRSRAEPAGSVDDRPPTAVRPGRREATTVPVRRNHPEFHDSHARGSARRSRAGGARAVAPAPRRLARPDRPTATGCSSGRKRRLLFLDDDPNRAEVFLKDNPQAVWVTTVPDCLARLAEPWDEVHLDHDLGGKMFVDSADTDCGMEVIRWLCKEPRAHLKDSLLLRPHAQRDRGAADGLADAVRRLQGRVPPVRPRPGAAAGAQRDGIGGPNLAGIGGSAVSSRCGRRGASWRRDFDCLPAWCARVVPRSARDERPLRAAGQTSRRLRRSSGCDRPNRGRSIQPPPRTSRPGRRSRPGPG